MSVGLGKYGALFLLVLLLLYYLLAYIGRCACGNHLSIFEQAARDVPAVQTSNNLATRTITVPPCLSILI